MSQSKREAQKRKNEVKKMMYTVIWRKRGMKSNWGLYIEYKDADGTKSILDFLDKNKEYELVSITPCED